LNKGIEGKETGRREGFDVSDFILKIFVISNLYLQFYCLDYFLLYWKNNSNIYLFIYLFITVSHKFFFFLMN